MDNHELVKRVKEWDRKSTFPLSPSECKAIYIDWNQWINGFIKEQQEKTGNITIPKRDQDELEENHHIPHSLQKLLDYIDAKEFRVHDFWSNEHTFDPEVYFLGEQHYAHLSQRGQILHLFLDEEYIKSRNGVNGATPQRNDIICSEGYTGEIDFSSITKNNAYTLGYNCKESERRKQMRPQITPVYYILNKLKQKNIPFIFNDNTDANTAQAKIEDSIDDAWRSIRKGDKSIEKKRAFKYGAEEWCKQMIFRLDSYLSTLLSDKHDKKLQLCGAVDFYFLDYIPISLKEAGIPYLCVTPKQMYMPKDVEEQQKKVPLIL